MTQNNVVYILVKSETNFITSHVFRKQNIDHQCLLTSSCKHFVIESSLSNGTMAKFHFMQRPTNIVLTKGS